MGRLGISDGLERLNECVFRDGPLVRLSREEPPFHGLLQVFLCFFDRFAEGVTPWEHRDISVIPMVVFDNNCSIGGLCHIPEVYHTSIQYLIYHPPLKWQITVYGIGDFYLERGPGGGLGD